MCNTSTATTKWHWKFDRPKPIFWNKFDCSFNFLTNHVHRSTKDMPVNNITYILFHLCISDLKIDNHISHLSISLHVLKSLTTIHAIIENLHSKNTWEWLQSLNYITSNLIRETYPKLAKAEKSVSGFSKGTMQSCTTDFQDFFSNWSPNKPGRKFKLTFNTFQP